MNREIHAFKSSAITIAEDLQNNTYLTKSDVEGGAGFSAQWDANFVHPIRDVITLPDDAGRDMLKVRNALYHSYNHDVFQRVVYTESHDEVANGKSRIPSEVDKANPESWFAQKRAALGIALTLTAPGIPMLFQGQEMLQDGWFQDSEPMPWENAEEHAGIGQLTAKLIRLRRNIDGVTKGLTGQKIDVFHINNKDKVVAYRRSYDGGAGDDVIVIVNFANRKLDDYEFGLPAGGSWKRRFSSDRKEYSEAFKGQASGDIQADARAYDGQTHRGRIHLPPYTAIIYSQDPR